MIVYRRQTLVREVNAVHIPDQTDWQIVTLLNEDGRMSSTEIAERLGNITARTVNNRIKALTKDGIIHIRAVVNPEKVGYVVLADVYIEVEPGLAHEVGLQLAKFPEISYVACVVGDVDVSISVRSRTIPELFDFVEGQLGKIAGVRRTQTYVLPYKIKEIDTWMPPNAIDVKGNRSQVTLQYAQID
jgi:Lrp/AsnC family transcriptional regulator for asnA, asnC and gidA